MNDELPTGVSARIGSLRFRHGGRVGHAAFAPDGLTIASSDDEGVLRRWDATGAPIDVRAAAPFAPLVFTPAGALLFATDDHRVVALDGGLETIVDGGPEPIVEIALADDGDTLAVTRGEDGVVVWSVAGRDWKQRLPHAGRLIALAFVGDGDDRWLVAGTDDGTVTAWDADGIEVASRGLPEGPAVSGIAHVDGRIVVGTERGLVWLDRPDLAPSRAEGVDDGVTGLARTPAGSLLVDEGGALAERADDGRLLRRLPGRGFDGAPAFSPDGASFVIPWGPFASVHDAATGDERFPEPGHTDAVVRLAFSPDGARIASGGQDRRVLVSDARTGAILARFGHTDAPRRTVGHPYGLAFSPDGRRVVTAGDDATVRLWDADGREVRRIGSVIVYGLAWGRWIALAEAAGTIRLLDADLNEVAVLSGHRSGAQAVAFVGDDVVSVGNDHRVVRWDVDGAAPRWSRRGPSSPGGSVAVAGSRIVAGGWSDETLVFDLDGNEVAPIPTGPTDAVALSPDGARVATAHRSMPPRIWDAATGALLETREARPGRFVRALAWAIDGRLATGHTNGLVHVWR